MTIILKKTKITKDRDPHEILITNLPDGDVLIMVGWAVDVYTGIKGLPTKEAVIKQAYMQGYVDARNETPIRPGDIAKKILEQEAQNDN